MATKLPIGWQGMALPHGPMHWHDISDPANPELDKLAASYSLHRLHVEDCRQDVQRTKADEATTYIFLSLKLLALDEKSRLAVRDLSLFVGSDFLITVHKGAIPVLEALRESEKVLRPDQVLHRVMDGIADSYLPLVDRLEDTIEALHDEAVSEPSPAVLQSIGDIRSTLLELRRVLSATRHVAFQLRHVHNPVISADLLPFLRDVHDDLAIMLETLVTERGRLAGVLDVYFSGIAYRAMDATKTLSLLGTIALPTLVIASIFGMNIEYPQWVRSRWMFALLVVLTLLLTGFLLWYLRRKDFLPRGKVQSSARGRKSM